MTPTDIAEGYEKALKKALEVLPQMVCEKVADVRDKAVMMKAMNAAIMAKQYGNHEFLTGLISDACGGFVYIGHSNRVFGC